MAGVNGDIASRPFVADTRWSCLIQREFRRSEENYFVNWTRLHCYNSIFATMTNIETNVLSIYIYVILYLYIRYIVFIYTLYCIYIYVILYLYIRYIVFIYTLYCIYIYAILYLYIRYIVFIYTLYCIYIYVILYLYIRYIVFIYTLYCIYIYVIYVYIYTLYCIYKLGAFDLSARNFHTKPTPLIYSPMSFRIPFYIKIYLLPAANTWI